MCPEQLPRGKPAVVAQKKIEGSRAGLFDRALRTLPELFLSLSVSLSLSAPLPAASGSSNEFDPFAVTLLLSPCIY